MNKKNLFLWISFFMMGSVLAEDMKIGQKAPEFNLEILEGGKTVSLSDFKGQVVLVDFWASWCAPCKISLPMLDELANKFKNMKVIAVNIDDDKANAFTFLKDMDVSLTVVHDSTKKVVALYNVPEMPTAYLIDQYGYIQFIHSGYKREDMRKLEFKVRGLLDRR